MKITLKHPIPANPKDPKAGVLATLEFKRLKAKHLKLFPASFFSGEGGTPPEEFIPLLAGIADISVESAEEIDMEDWTDLISAFGEHLGNAFPASL